MTCLRRSVVLAVCLLTAAVAVAHFQVLLPNDDSVSQDGPREVDFNIVFTHPMEQGPTMEMGKPVRFGVMVDGKKTDLLGSLKARKDQGKTAYSAAYTFRQPGDHVFYIEPAAYWEPGEGKMIVHYTKVAVDAFGGGQGWDAMVGFPVEIRPLTRPYGLWTGNSFRGVVVRGGKPVPHAEVEVEYWNEGKKVKAPGDAHVTQVVKADASGVFVYTMPRAGWWGFAALVDGPEKMKNPEGKMVDVEWGALMWVKCRDMK